MGDKLIRVAVGLSGGVDSSLSAAMLVEEGYEVTGVFLECWREPGCRAEEDRKDALAVALKLKIPFVVLDFRKEYKERVVEYFYREYEAGRTPNPDTMCNREIKFGMFYEWAMDNDFDYVATGHYARVQRIQLDSPSHKASEEQGNLAREEYGLVRGKDVGKDQSYFLYQIRPEQLAHILFPVGGMLKSQVREEAKKRGLATASKPDSQGICFIGEVDVRKLLRERIKERRGEIVFGMKNFKHQASSSKQYQNTKNQNSKLFDDRNLVLGTYDNYEVVGVHEGVAFYTVGQRVGKGLDKKRLKELNELGKFPYDPAEMPVLYVVGKDVVNNRLVVGFEEDTYKSQFVVREIKWLVSRERFENLARARGIWVRIRNLGELVEARVQLESSAREERLTATLSRPVRGVAEGQACVLYSDSSVDAVVLGGGVINC